MSTSCTVAVLGLLAAILNFGRAIIARVSRPSARQRAANGGSTSAGVAIGLALGAAIGAGAGAAVAKKGG